MFDRAFEKTLGLEGGYSNHALDPGGKTKYGITEATFKEAKEKGIVSGVEKVLEITKAQAKAIYQVMWWFPLKLDDITNPDIAEEIFDTAVNMGRSKAVLIAQVALQYLGERVTADGIMGPETIGRINKWCKKDPEALFKVLNGFQFIHYVLRTNEGLVQTIKTRTKCDPSQQVFAYGWMKRIQNYTGGKENV